MSPVSFESGDANNDNVLDLSESWIYTCSTPVSSDLTNIATVMGVDSLDGVVSAQASADVDVIAPAIGLSKRASASIIHAGTVVTYTFTVTNAGDVPLSNVNVSDDLCAPVVYGGGDDNSDSRLDLGETWTYTCAAMLNADTFNTATATGTDALGGPVSAQASARVDVINPGLRVTKAASTAQVYAGETVSFTYTVINTGDTPLATLTATDDWCAPVNYATGDLNNDSRLDLTESWTYTCHTVLTQTTTNTITVTGQDELGGSTGDTDSVTVAVLAFGSIGDRVWMDVNRNGIQDSGEPGMADVGVVLLTGGGTVAGTTFTNSSGAFRFDGLRAGTYQLSFTPPSGFVFTAPNHGHGRQRRQRRRPGDRAHGEHQPGCGPNRSFVGCGDERNPALPAPDHGAAPRPHTDADSDANLHPHAHCDAITDAHGHADADPLSAADGLHHSAFGPSQGHGGPHGAESALHRQPGQRPAFGGEWADQPTDRQRPHRG